MCSDLDMILLMGRNRVTCQLQLREHGRAEAEERKVGGAQIEGGREQIEEGRGTDRGREVNKKREGGKQIEGGRETDRGRKGNRGREGTSVPQPLHTCTCTH